MRSSPSWCTTSPATAYTAGNENLDVELAAIDPVETICLRRRPRLPPADLAAITTACRAAVQDAAAQWLTPGPASRPPAEVVFDIATVLFQYNLIRRPPRKV